MAQLLTSILLLEGITHLEDLPLDDFVRAVETLKNNIVTEKLDGANLWFGVDEDGLYSSREGKSKRGGRFRSTDDFSPSANHNAFRGAHAALEKVEPIILKHLKPGDAVEIEVLFGRQPNTVAYGAEDKSYISLIRPVGDTTEDTFKALLKALDGKEVKAEAQVISSPDGDRLESQDEVHTWKFTQAQPVDAKKLDTSAAMAKLKELNAFLKQKNADLKDKTNQEVAELSMTSVPKAQREAAKTARERVLATILNDFKLPIKELLLAGFVRKLKPKLQADKLHPAEDLGVEGVVARDPVTGAQLKLVDKDIFTTINTFNSAVTNALSGLVRTTDQDATIESRGGVFGQAKIRIADLLGAKELAMSSGVRRFITKFKGKDVTETATALAKALNVNNVSAARNKISAILTSTLTDIQALLDSFKKEADGYKLVLKTGKELGLSPAVMKRTLTAFAETKQEINQIITAVDKSRTLPELLMALYGRTINSLHDGSEEAVKEAFTLIKSISEEGEGAEGATTAGDVAALPNRLFSSNKVIQRRKRKFTKSKAYPAPEMMALSTAKIGESLLKSIVREQSAVAKAEFATDVDDSAAASNDIEFKQLRNNVAINTDVTQMDVSRYLNKAHELNDEVDTITFGMELDDGSVVKVYVNAQDADKFEAALANMLGQEDDVEAVINLMADQFDIVDVEWPQPVEAPVEPEAETGVELEVEPTTDEVSAEEPTVDEVPTDEVPAEEPTDGIEAGGDEESVEEPAPEEGADEQNGEEGSETGAEPAADEVDGGFSVSDEDEDETEDEEGTAPDADAEEEEFELDDEGNPVLDDEGNPVPKKKESTKKEESQMSIGQLFKQKLLAEKKAEPKSAPKAKKEESDQEHEEELQPIHDAMPPNLKRLLDSMPRGRDKAIVMMMHSLGAPVDALVVKKSELRKNVQPLGDRFAKDSQFRMWMKRLMERLVELEGKGEVTENIGAQLNSVYQKMVYAVLMQLGLPASIEKIARTKLLNGIRAKAAIFQDDSDARVMLRMIGGMLGIEHMTGMTNNELKKLETMKEEIELTEANAQELTDKAFELMALMGVGEKEIKMVGQQKLQVKRNLMNVRDKAKFTRAMDWMMQLLKASPNEKPETTEVQEGEVLNSNAIVTELKRRYKNDKDFANFDDAEVQKIAKWIAGGPQLPRQLELFVNDWMVKRGMIKAQAGPEAMDEYWAGQFENLQEHRGKPKAKTGPVANPPEIRDEMDDSDKGIEKDFARGMTRAQKKAAETAPADMGKWNIAVVGSGGVLLKNKAMQVRMDAEQAEKLVDAIGTAKVVNVVAKDGQRFVFRPINRGQSYAVKAAGDNVEFPNGVLITNAQLDQILDAISAG